MCPSDFDEWLFASRAERIKNQLAEEERAWRAERLDWVISGFAVGFASAAVIFALLAWILA